MEEGRIGVQLAVLNNLLKREMAHVTDGREEAEGLTGMQGMIIHFLMESGQDDRFQKDIETAFQIRRSTATGILQLMEQRGLIVREPVARDARLKRLRLTERACALHESICARLAHMEAVMRRDISEKELAVWFAVCDKISANLERYGWKNTEERI